MATDPAVQAIQALHHEQKWLALSDPYTEAIVAAVRPVVIRECAEAIEVQKQVREDGLPPYDQRRDLYESGQSAGYISGLSEAIGAVRGLAGEAK